MVLCHPRPPLLFPLLLPECALGLPTTRAETRTRASQVPSAPANDSSTAVRYTRPVRRQHCRGHLRLFRKMLVYLSPACPTTQHKLPLLRAHGRVRRLLQILTVQYRREGTSVASAVSLSQGTIPTKGTRASCAVLLGHGPNSAKGTRAHSAVPLSRGINSATGVRISNAAPLNHGKGACASRAAPPSHASPSNEADATVRRPPKRTCSPSPLSDHVVAVGLRCGKANSKTLLPGHEVAVGLRCGKANTKTPRSLVRLDPVFPRDSSGRSILFPSRRSRRD